MADSFGSAPVGSAVQPCPLAKKPEHWIEIELIGEDDRPIPWEQYSVVLPDGKIVEGFLDDLGFARIDQLEADGVCRVSFPNLDQDAYEFVRTLAARGGK